MALERRFFVEAKTFLFSVEEGNSMLSMEERRKGFFGVVLLGLQCTAWVVTAVKEALWSQGLEDFVKSFQEDLKAWIVRKGCNKDGRFLELVVYAVGGRSGFILFPKGLGGRGWNRVVDELCKVMVFLETGSPYAIASSAFASPPEAMRVPFGCSNLDSKGFSPALDFSEVGLNSFGVYSLGAAAFGRKAPLFSSDNVEVWGTGALIYPSESKSVLRYQQRSKVGKGAQMDASLFDEAVTALSAPTTPSLGASSQALDGTVVQSSPKPGGGVVGKSPSSSFLRRGFLLPSVCSPLDGCASPIAERV